MPIIANQTNPWGRQQGPEIQRSDLWVVDFTQALSGVNTALTASISMSTSGSPPVLPTTVATYYAKSIALPDLKTRAEATRRDSKPYQMPSWDEPVEGIRIVFWLDCATGLSSPSPYTSILYNFLTAWRSLVRAGRGAMSSEYAIQLNANYSIDYAFDIDLLLLRSSSNPIISVAEQTTSNSNSSVRNDLEFSTQLHLVNAWLGSFKVSDLNYENAQLVQLDTIFYAEDILNRIPVVGTHYQRPA